MSTQITDTFRKGVHEPVGKGIDQIGETAGKRWKGLMDMMPGAKMFDKMTGGALGRIVENTPKKLAETINKGREDALKTVECLSKGDFKGAARHGFDYAKYVADFVMPARGGAKVLGQEAVKGGVQDAAKDEVRTPR